MGLGKGYRGRCSLVGILNCRGWWSREVVVNLVLQQLNIFRRARTAKKEKWPGYEVLASCVLHKLRGYYKSLSQYVANGQGFQHVFHKNVLT